MAANTNPIFSLVGDIQWGAQIIAANTAKDGTGTVTTVFTADATNGGYVDYLRVRPAGTNGATVLRVFINNGSTNATAGNNTLFDEASIAGTTNSESSAIAGTQIPIGFALPPGYKLNCTLGTTVAGGIAVTGIGGKY